MPVARMPLIADLSKRLPNEDKDYELVNCFVEFRAGGQRDAGGRDARRTNDIMFVVKRSGIVDQQTITAPSGAARALTTTQNGDIYVVLGDTIYRNGTALAGSPHFTTTSGKLTYDEFAASTASPSGGLIFNDETDLVKVDLGTFAVSTVALPPSFSGTLQPGYVVLDQFGFIQDSLGRIWNTSVGEPDDFTNDDFLTAEVLPDQGKGIRRHLNYIYAFGRDSTEVFYDAANATGSPLSRFDGTVNLHGCPNSHTSATLYNAVYYVGHAQGGGYTVMQLNQGFQPNIISNQEVAEALDEEGIADDLASAFAIVLETMGHPFYILVLPQTDKAYAWDVSTQLWSRWTTFNGSVESRFLFIDSAKDDGFPILLPDVTAPTAVQRMDPEIYQDDGQEIRMEGTTDKLDFGTKQKKFCYRLQFIGDVVGTSPTNLAISWSDDDYQTFTTPRNLDISAERFRLTRLGTFSRRAWKYAFTANQPFRAEALELNVETGHYATN